jgi:hypothetical protein
MIRIHTQILGLFARSAFSQAKAKNRNLIPEYPEHLVLAGGMRHFLDILQYGTCADLCCVCRACPGRHLAEATIWIEIASMLSVFTFSPAKDKYGRDIDISYATVPEGELISLVFLASFLVASSTECD